MTELVQQRKAELAAKHEAAEAAAATEAKSQFLARMSHEIRTPLNGMIAVGQLLAETNLTPQQWDFVNTIRCSGEALLTLISDILDFSKIEANKMELENTPFYLESTVEAAVEIAGMQAAQKRLQLAYFIHDDVPPWIIGDDHRLQQVLLNILNNAVKFTEEGEIVLEIWSQSVRNSTANLPKASEIHFRVKDSGIGIADEDILGFLNHSLSLMRPLRGNSEVLALVSQSVRNCVRPWVGKCGPLRMVRSKAVPLIGT